MFDPSIGRWAQEDPKRFLAGDANFDRYVGNDPINATDRNGLDANDDRFFQEAGIYDTGSTMKSSDEDTKEYKGRKLTGKSPNGTAISFTFEDAAKGDYPVRSAGGKMGRGVYVKIRFDIDSDRYDSIRIIQVWRRVDQGYRGQGRRKESIDPDPTERDPSSPRRERAGWWKGLYPPSKGWGVDVLEKTKSPFYAALPRSSPFPLRNDLGSGDVLAVSVPLSLGRRFLFTAHCFAIALE